MDSDTKRMVNIAVAWCGPVFVLGYIIFWAMLGHNVPPPNVMGMTPEQLVSEYYGKYQSEISVGMIGCCVVGLIYTPWSLLLASMLRDDDGQLGVLSMMEAAGGILTGWVLAFCPAIWGTCAILTNQVSPELVRSLHVMGWVIYDCTFMVTSIQLFGLGAYTVLNKKQKIFPAWAGWFAIAVGVIFIPLVLIPFVSEGPFAVSGMWNFYIVFGTWLFGFFVPYSFFMLKATMGVSRGAHHTLRPAH